MATRRMTSKQRANRATGSDLPLDVREALSRGFDAGNYANAYVSTNLEEAWDALDDEDDDPREGLSRDAKKAFRAAFVIGFFGSYEEDEIDSDFLDDWMDAMGRWAPAMSAQGIAASRDDNEARQRRGKRRGKRPLFQRFSKR